jgi:hypothetical protein
MSRHLLRIYWMDDEPDRLKESLREAIKEPEQSPGRRADLTVVELGGDKGIAAILDELDRERRKGSGPHLIVIDQILQLTNADAYLQRGSSLAAAIRDKDPAVPLVGVTGAELADVGELQKQQFIEFFVRDNIATGANIPDLYAIADGYGALVAFHATSLASSTLAQDICKLFKCPPADHELFTSIIPGVYKSAWDNGTRHTFARWVWHNLLGRPGLTYDELEAATLLGLKVEGFAKLRKRLRACEYKGIFASASRARWWVSLLREYVRKLTGGAVSDPIWELGRHLANDKADLFSKCHGRPNSSEVPTVVAYSDGTKRKRIQARIQDSAPLETDTPPLGFEQRRIYDPTEK